VPKNVDAFLRDNFQLFFVFAVVWCGSWMAYLLWRRSRRGPRFPRLEEVELLFQEKSASGNSHKSFITRLGGAHNCLRIVVTREEVWVTTYFPFTAFVGFYDLEHRIRRDAITDVQRNGK